MSDSNFLDENQSSLNPIDDGMDEITKRSVMMVLGDI